MLLRRLYHLNVAVGPHWGSAWNKPFAFPLFSLMSGEAA